MAEWRWGGCSAGRVRGRKAWTRWWRTDCCWSPAGLALEGDPGGAGWMQASKHRSVFIDNSHIANIFKMTPADSALCVSFISHCSSNMGKLLDYVLAEKKRIV